MRILGGYAYLVIASQRVRPEVAGPMISSAKQSTAARQFFTVAGTDIGRRLPWLRKYPAVAADLRAIAASVWEVLRGWAENKSLLPERRRARAMP
jgi:hypothetical protein